LAYENELMVFSFLRGHNRRKLSFLLQPKGKSSGRRAILQEIAGVIKVHPDLSAALM